MSDNFQTYDANSGLRNIRTTDDGTAHHSHHVMEGVRNDGSLKALSATAEGHLAVSIHGPLLPFGSLHVEELDPVFQIDGVYGINTTQLIANTGLGYDPGPTPGSNSGSNTCVDNLLKCSTGTTLYSFATMQSKQRLRYRAGQGVLGRHTALYSAPAAGSIVVAGYGTGESGFYFGYNGLDFGILHSTGGKREVQTLTVSAGTTGAGTVVVTLGGLQTTVTLAVVGTPTATAYELSKQTYPGWTAVQRGATVVFLANSVGNKTGTFSLALGTATGAAGTFAETLAGVASTDTWITQTAWNGDKLDGTGPSGVTLDPSKGNVYQIGIQYLGFGAITFQVEAGLAGDNPSFVTVHTINAQNTRTSVTASQPSFPFTMAAYSATSTTDVSISVGSVGGFIEGHRHLTGPRMSYYNTANSSTGTYTPLFTVRNLIVFKDRANQAVVNLISASGATKSTNGLTVFYLIKNATLTGVPNFQPFAANSCTYWDTAATGCSFDTNDQIIRASGLGESGGFDFTFSDRVELQPGETVTLAVKSVAATATCVGMLNTREDQ